VTRNFFTYADRYGDAYQKYNGIDVTINARPRNGLTFQGGLLGRLFDVGQLRGA
jgi:hypothetical protein